MKLNGYNCKIEYLAGKDNTCADLLSRVLKQLEAESVELEPGVDDKVYLVQIINSDRLKDRPSWEDEVKEVIRDPHWMEQVGQSQEKEGIAELRKKVEAGKTTEYLIQEDRLYYPS